MKIVISNQAKKDIIDIYKYIALDSPRYAKETIQNIQKDIHKLEETPFIGRYVPERTDKLYRELIYKNYRIIYNISEYKIYIHFVINRKRNIKKFF